METCELFFMGLVAFGSIAVGTLFFFISKYITSKFSEERGFINGISILVGLVFCLTLFFGTLYNMTTMEDIKAAEERKETEEIFNCSYEGIKQRIDSHFDEYRDCISKGKSYVNSDKRSKALGDCHGTYGYKNLGYWRGEISDCNVSDSEQDKLLDYWDEQFEERMN